MEATEQGHAPHVPAMNKAIMWAQDGAVAIVSGEVTIAVVNAI